MKTHTRSFQEKNDLILITGERGSGKTKHCFELIRAARAAGAEPVGVVSPAVYEQEMKTGIDLLDIRSGERRRLALLHDQHTEAVLAQYSLAKGTWLFDPDVLAWGNRILQGLQPGKLLIVDELGPLELLDQLGLTAGIAQINRRGFSLTYVVIRPALLQNARQRWPWAKEMHLPGGKREHDPDQ